jgi:hypothetical protein
MAALILFAPSVTGVAQAGSPNLTALKLVTHLPPELPQRTMGLAFDREKLWAMVWPMKDNALSSIDPATGMVTAQYRLAGLKRASGLAWANSALWISEFDGKIWQLLFQQ